MQDLANAVESWSALFHLAPEMFERVIEATDFPDWAPLTKWRVALEQDFDPEMTPEWFPAWILLEDPGLAAALRPRRTDDDPSRAADATIALQAHPSLDGHGIELRRSLQATYSGLLERSLTKRAAARRACAVIGVENGIDRPRGAKRALAYAGIRLQVARPDARRWNSCHCCAPNCRALMPTPCALMTD